MSKDTQQLAICTATGFVIGSLGFHALSVYRNRKAYTKPKLYIYDHCPFSVRARMILGLKSVDYELVFMESADFNTPINLVGSKQAPIFQLSNAQSMAESMDIVRFVDQNYNGKPILFESSNREDLNKWITTYNPVINALLFPRYYKSLLPEFARLESREYYRNSKEKKFGKFSMLETKSLELKKELERGLVDLEKLFLSKSCINQCLSYDDIDLFGRLRGITIIKDLKIPKTIRSYLESMSARSDIRLYDELAI